MKDTQEEPLDHNRENRRRSSRVPIDMLVTYWVDIQDRTQSYKVKSLNLSEEGIFIIIDTPLALGTEVLLRFSLPRSGDTLTVRGEVKWMRHQSAAEEGPAGKGIRFKDLAPESKRLLKEFIRNTKSPVREEND
jgi:uncharacterized protein (TIGR02266 family)